MSQTEHQGSLKVGDGIQPVTEALHHHLGIALEGIGCGTRRPAAIAHKRQRQIPVIERGIGLDATRLAAIDKSGRRNPVPAR